MNSYYVLLKESASLFHFRNTINSVFGKESPALDYVGGQNSSVIVYGSLYQLSHPAIRKMIDSAFELPLLAKIESGVILKLAEALYKTENANEVQSIMIHYLADTDDVTSRLQHTLSNIQVSAVSGFKSSLQGNSFKSEEQRIFIFSL